MGVKDKQTPTVAEEPIACSIGCKSWEKCQMGDHCFGGWIAYFAFAAYLYCSHYTK
jgi:hypothetical protein